MALKTRYFNRKRLVEYVQEKAKERGRGFGRSRGSWTVWRTCRTRSYA